MRSAWPSKRTLAFAAENWASPLPSLHPSHDMVEMPSMETLGTPYYSVAEVLPAVFGFGERAVPLLLLRIPVVDSEGEEADGTFRQHIHTIEAKHDLVSIILIVIVLALHTKLLLFDLFGIGGDSLGD